MCVSEPYKIKRELQGVTVCMCVCVKERDGVVLQSFGGHNKQKETQGHRKMKTADLFDVFEHVSNQHRYLSSNKLHPLYNIL